MSKLMGYLPRLLHEIKEMKELTQTEEKEIEAVAQAVQQFLDNQFVTTAQEWAIKRREEMIGIRADPTTETLEFRRDRLINRYSTLPPFTIRYLQSRLDSLIGQGVAKVEVDEQNFVLKITMSVPDAAYFKEIEHTVQIVKPVNLLYNQGTSMADHVGIEEHIWRTPLTRMSRLSTTWKLGSTPFAKGGKEEQVK
ncbi:putative phage tail protein [Paenibacillus elgii]|uniref:putative phage tail protein n=1 Tax=Paenibacillus elgii TaxID=189691 RepID=UPI00203C2F60|nr:putative phage tail protein [Paenibacillus elgii]MCM3273650.1 YmfQ family protein [Paenibacillus elgii]